jgi:pyrimidine-nucleoside phosphorylase
MWQPLGYAVGNAIEVVEAIECLKGRWPADLRQVTFALGAEMLLLAGRARNRAGAAAMLLEAVATGRALAKLRRVISAQGGDPRVCDRYGLLPGPACRLPVRAGRGGRVTEIDALRVGQLGIELGVGRSTVESRIEHGAGFLFRRKVADAVSKGETVCEVLAPDRASGRRVAAALARVIRISSRAPARRPLLLGRLTAARPGI